MRSWAVGLRTAKHGIGKRTACRYCPITPLKEGSEAFAGLPSIPLGALAEPARGGYRRLLAWTMALFPVPDDWSRARDVLGSLGDRAVGGDVVSPADLFDAACHAYRVRPATVRALCDWMRGA